MEYFPVVCVCIYLVVSENKVLARCLLRHCQQIVFQAQTLSHREQFVPALDCRIRWDLRSSILFIESRQIWTRKVKS